MFFTQIEVTLVFIKKFLCGKKLAVNQKDKLN